MRLLSFLCAICWCVLGPVCADAQAVATRRSGAVGVQRVELPSVESAARPGPARVQAGAQLKTDSNKRLPHGLVGATIGAIVGGAIGYARVQMYCDGADPCNATRSTVTGAAVGAALGVLVEYFVRNGQR
jgi:hypothetical protein